MINGNSKRVVVIKDIHSNLIEEAILILKSEPGSRDAKEKNDNGKKRNNDFLLKEAELIINNYVRENKENMTKVKETKKKISPERKKYLTSTIINISLIGSIALLIFFVSKMF